MTSVFSGPQYVNRVRESWQAGTGPTISSPAGGGLNPLGATLDLWFADIDESYATGATLDLRLDSDRYYEWALPAAQGSYQVWVGYAPWEPSLDLDFVRQIYQEAI
jgi:hypothetical protein